MLVVHGRDDQGVLVAHGDQGGGYSLYVEDGVLTFGYNQYGEMRFVQGADSPPALAGSCPAPRPALDSRGTSSSLHEGPDRRPGAPAPYDPQHLVEAMRSAGRRGQ